VGESIRLANEEYSSDTILSHEVYRPRSGLRA
jgi:hypothetical protein